MVVTLTEGAGEGLSTPQPLQIFHPKPWKVPQILTERPRLGALMLVIVCGWKQELWDRQGKEASSNSEMKQHESCSDDTPAPHLLAATLIPPGPSAALWGTALQGNYHLGAGCHTSQSCVLEEKWCLCWKAGRDGLKMASSKVSNTGKLGREQVARTHIWKSFMAIICHHLKPRIISIITRRYTWAQRITIFSRIVVINPIVGRA